MPHAEKPSTVQVMYAMNAQAVHGSGLLSGTNMLNDTKNPFASHKDRHEKIGEGHLGLDAISKVINHPKLKKLTFYLETPNEIEGYAKEIKMLKEVYK